VEGRAGIDAVAQDRQHAGPGALGFEQRVEPVDNLLRGPVAKVAGELGRIAGRRAARLVAGRVRVV
jgi:hypothetical protein